MLPCMDLGAAVRAPKGFPVNPDGHRTFVLKPDPSVLDKRGRIKPHRWEESHDVPGQSTCWYCLRHRDDDIHKARCHCGVPGCTGHQVDFGRSKVRK